LELECHCLIEIWSWNVIVLEKLGAGMSLLCKNWELECHCLNKNLELEYHCLVKIWSWNVIVLEKFGAGMSLSYEKN
jgi:hypothetical protein